MQAPRYFLSFSASYQKLHFSLVLHQSHTEPPPTPPSLGNVCMVSVLWTAMRVVANLKERTYFSSIFWLVNWVVTCQVLKLGGLFSKFLELERFRSSFHFFNSKTAVFISQTGLVWLSQVLTFMFFLSFQNYQKKIKTILCNRWKGEFEHITTIV